MGRKVHQDESPGRLAVCFVDHSAKSSGAEIALLRLISATGVAATVVLGEHGPLEGLLLQAGARVFVRPLPSAISAVERNSGIVRSVRGAVSTAWYVLSLAVFFRRAGIRLVHTNSMKAHLYGGLAARLAGCVLVCHVRDRVSPDYLSLIFTVAVRLFLYTVPHRVLSNSRCTANTLWSESEVVYDCQPWLTEANRVAGQWPGGDCDDISEEIRLVGIVGRISPWKGQHVLIEALQIANIAGIEGRVIGGVLFSEHNYESFILDQARRSIVPISFAGQVEDVFGELRGLDILVHASTIPEPFGQVIVEAMAAGVPVIASASGAPLEIIEEGVDGALFQPGDAVDLAQCLTNVCGRRAKALSRQRLADRSKIRLQCDRSGCCYVYMSLTLSRSPSLLRRMQVLLTVGRGGKPANGKALSFDPSRQYSRQRRARSRTIVLPDACLSVSSLRAPARVTNTGEWRRLLLPG